MRKIIEIFAQLIISTTIFAGIFYAALPKYDHAEAQNTLRNHFTIMFRVQQGIGRFQNDRLGPAFAHIWKFSLAIELSPTISFKTVKELAGEMTKEISVIHEAVTNIAAANNEVSSAIFPIYIFYIKLGNCYCGKRIQEFG